MDWYWTATIADIPPQTTATINAPRRIWRSASRPTARPGAVGDTAATFGVGSAAAVMGPASP